MNFPKKILNLIAVIGLTLFLFPQKTLAVCPVCTITVTAGVGLCRWLGVDDTISGVWIGGLLVSTIIWTINWLDQKQIKFRFRKILVTLGYYAMVILPLYFADIIGHPQNKLWGQDKLMVGIIAGTIAFLLGVYLNDYLKRRNNGKAYFAFQKVLIPLSALTVASVIFYFINKCQ